MELDQTLLGKDKMQLAQRGRQKHQILFPAVSKNKKTKKRGTNY